MSAHTPGPWHRNIRADGRYVTVFAGRNHHVAAAVQQKLAAETEANIDLIAAAPELLESLKEVCDWINGCLAADDDSMPTPEMLRETERIAEKALAVIRKAEGA